MVGTAAEIMDAASDALAMGWTVLTAAGSPVTADGLAAMRAKMAPPPADPRPPNGAAPMPGDRASDVES